MYDQYFNKNNEELALGEEIYKDGLATIHLLNSDPSKAVKIFKPQTLQKEVNLAKRIEELNQLAQIADFELPFGSSKKTIGAWPKDVVKDYSGNVVGYIMDTVNGGIDLSYIVMARDPKTAFYKYRNSSDYPKWIKYFLYNSECLRNRFILSYNLSMSFDKIFNLKAKDGRKIDLDLCNFDIKPQKILVSIENINSKDYIVPFLFDLDNVTLNNSSGKLAPSAIQFSPEYKAPEGPIDKYYDYWSLAVIFYQLIFDQHPFDAVLGGTRFSDGTERDFFIKNKCFPWGRNRKFLSVGTQNDFRHGNFLKVSLEIQQLFIRAFDSDDRSQRPSMAEWSKALLAFLQNGNVDFKNLFVFDKTELPIQFNAPEIIFSLSDKEDNSLPYEESKLPSQIRKSQAFPVILLIDISDSMNEEIAGVRIIDELNKNLQSIKDAILSDPILLERVEIGIVSFSEDAKVEKPIDVVTQESSFPVLKSEVLKADLVAGFNKAIQVIDERKAFYRSNNIAFYRPLILLITVGKSTNTQSEIEALDAQIQQMSDIKKFILWSFGVGNADLKLIAKLAPQSANEHLRNKEVVFKIKDWSKFNIAMLLKSLNRPGMYIEGDFKDVENYFSDPGFDTIYL